MANAPANIQVFVQIIRLSLNMETFHPWRSKGAVGNMIRAEVLKPIFPFIRIAQPVFNELDGKNGKTLLFHRKDHVCSHELQFFYNLYELSNFEKIAAARQQD